MAHGHRRRHVSASGRPGRGVVAWGIVGLAAGFGLLVGFGVPWPKALLGTVGLLIVLLIAYALELSGLMRPTPEQSPGSDRHRPPGSHRPPGRPDEPPTP